MRNKVRFYVLIIAIILFIIQFFIADYDNFFGWSNLTPFISQICIIIAMSGSIIYVNKKQKK
jgi:ABC-type xylose transport system permease subunit